MTGDLLRGLPGLVIEFTRPMMTEYGCRCGETWSLSLEPPPCCIPASCCGSALVPIGEPHGDAVPHEIGSRNLCVLCGSPAAS